MPVNQHRVYYDWASPLEIEWLGAPVTFTLCGTPIAGSIIEVAQGDLLVAKARIDGLQLKVCGPVERFTLGGSDA